MIKEAEKYQDLQSASWRPKRASDVVPILPGGLQDPRAADVSV